MRKPLIYSIILSACAITSCKLDTPPTCLTGEDKCEPNRHVPGAGIYQMCGKSNKWGNEFNCQRGCSTENNGCKFKDHDPLMPACSKDGEILCKTSDNHTFAFKCQYGYWQPEMCASDQCNHETGCVEEDLSCNTSDNFCIEVLGISALQVICGDGSWSISYCSQGSGCEGNICADTSIKACGEDRINCKEEIANWGEGSCTNDECVVKECKPGYHVYENACEQNDNENCGRHAFICTDGIECNKTLGKCGCDRGLTYCDKACVDLTSDINHCGGCGQNCEIEYSNHSVCKDSICKAESCQNGYHLYLGRCEKDDNTNCGNHNSPCSIAQVQGSTAVSCYTGQCIATACDSNNFTMDNNQHICLPKHSGGPCTNSICINSGNQGIFYECDLDTGYINEQGVPCLNTDHKVISCNSNGTACGSCLNGTSHCADNNHYISCYNGEEKQEDCSKLFTEENQYSFCSVIDNRAQCTSDCITGYHQDELGHCTQCQQGEVWDKSLKKCLKFNCIDLIDPKVGDTCIFGRYTQEEKETDLEWQILEIQSESFLMITKYVIDAKKFSTTDGGGETTNVWEKSSIRSWLNGFDKDSNTSNIDYTNDNFMKTAFTDEERDYIYKVYDNPNPTGETSDYVFLLSIDEAYEYFKSDTERKGFATPYATLMGVPVNVNATECIKDDYCIAAWWLRSPGNNDEYATFVYDSGHVNEYGYYASDKNPSGVRPALRLIR